MRSLVTFFASLLILCSADKLAPGQRAPIYASNAGGLSLQPPPQSAGAKAPIAILRESNRPNNGDGEYAFSYETADGVQREEVGKLKRVGDQLVNTVEGRFSYTSPEGLPIIVKYAADENGNRASFTFGTDPGRKSLSLRTKINDGDKGYLPPPPPPKTNDGYLPPKTNEYLPPQ